MTEALSILVVEDDPQALAWMVEILTAAGYAPCPAQSGAMALRSAQAKAPAAAILDLHLPDMNGLEVCRALRQQENTRDIPILFVSEAVVLDRSAGLKAGGSDYLSKPLNAEELLARLGTHLLLARRTQELAQVRRDWNATFDALSDAIALLDVDGRLLRCNAAMLRLLEAPLEDVQGRFCYEVMHPSLGRMEGCPFARMLASRRCERQELPLNGHWYEITIDPLFDDQGGIRGGVHHLRDIQEKVDAQAAREQGRGLYELLMQANHAMVQAKDPQPLFHSLVDLCAREAGFDLAWIGLITDDSDGGRFLCPAAAQGPAKQYVEGLRIPLDAHVSQRGPSARCVIEGVQVIVQDWRAETSVTFCRGRSERYGLRASAALPIRCQELVIGLLSLHSVVPGFMTDDRVRLLDRLSKDLSGTLDALAEARHAARQAMQARLVGELGLSLVGGPPLQDFLDQSVGAASQGLEVPFSNVLLCHRENRADSRYEVTSLRLVAGVGWHEGLVGRAEVPADRGSQAGFALASRAPILVRDLAVEARFRGPALLVDHGIRSGISVVIGPPEAPLGVFGAHALDVRDFTPEDASFLQELAHLVFLAHTMDRQRREIQVRDQLLGEGEARFRSLFEQSLFGMLVADAHTGAILDANPQVEHLLGWPKDSLSAMTFLDITHPEDRIGSAAIHTRMSQDVGSSEVIQKRYLHRDGHAVWCEIVVTPVADTKGPRRNLAVIKDISQRKAAEADLSRQVSVLEGILESSDAPIFSLDRDYRYTSFNRAHAAVMQSLYGIAISRGSCLAACMHPADWSVAQANLDRCLAGEAFTVEAPSGDPGRVQRIFQIRHNPVRDRDGLVTGVAVFASDVTELYQERRELARAHELLQQVQRIARVGGWEVDLVENRLRWSEGTYRIHDLDPAAYLPDVASSIQFYAPEWRPMITEAVGWAISEGRAFDLEMELLTGTGRRVWVRAIGEVERKGEKVVRVFGAFLDIDAEKRSLEAQRQAEQMLEKERHRLQAIFETAADGIALVDKDSLAILDANPAFCRSYGYTREELQTMRATDVSAQTEETSQATRGPATRVHGRMHRRKDGSIFPVDLVAGAFEEEGRRISVVSSRDISEAVAAAEALTRLTEDLERRVQERTAQLQSANEELEAFSYSVSHDLRAPLRAMTGFAQALQEDWADQFDAEARDYLDRIQRAGSHMGQLIEDLLRLSRVSRQDFQASPLDLSSLGTELCEALTREFPEHRVRWRVAPGMHAVGDRNLLRVALDNLLRNAWKFTLQALEAEVCFEPCEAGGFQVCDNGVGLPADKIGRLFTPFQRLHADPSFKGTGVGLSIVRRVIQRHGGHVWAEPREPHGACFGFTLPSMREPTAE